MFKTHPHAILTVIHPPNMKLEDVSSPMEQNLVKVLVVLRIILDHGINGINLESIAQPG